MSTNEKIVGIVSDKKPMTSTNPKAPKGKFKVGDKFLTVWDEEIWDAIEEGKSYVFNCTVQTNDYQGKTYTNYNVTSGMPETPLEKSDLVIVDLPVVVDESVKEIHLPQGVINYLKEML